MKLRRKRKLIQRQVGLHSILSALNVYKISRRRGYRSIIAYQLEWDDPGMNLSMAYFVRNLTYKYYASTVTKPKRNKRK